MENLVKRYKEECDIIPNTSNIIWKVGIIILLILCALSYYYYPKEYCLITILLAIEILILDKICNFINIMNIKKILKITSNYKRRKIYMEVDKFQKEWIIKYCRKNKLYKIQKINIIREELKNRDKELTKRYIDPIIMATLMLNIWEIVVQRLKDKFGLINSIIISILLAIIITLIIGLGKKEYEEDKQFFNIFKKMTGNKRLDELLLYASIKCNR